MALAYNSERGEVPLAIGGVDLVIAAEMERLAQISSRLQCQSFAELNRKLIGVELNTVLAAVEILTVRGDWGAARRALTLADLTSCQVAFTTAILHHAKDADGGKPAAAGTSEAMDSPGGNGGSLPSETSAGDRMTSGQPH